MTDWDLLTPGIGLTSIGVVGVGISLSGIAKTFLDGMHAVSLLTMYIGLIFLASGIFKDGFPTSGKAKSATFITLGFLVTIGFAAAVTVGTQVPSIFAYIGVILIIAIPAALLSVASYKRTPYFKYLAVIFIGAAIVGGSYFFALPKSPTPAEESTQQTNNSTQVTKITKMVNATILAGASAQGNPSYAPENLVVPKDGGGIEWTNKDNVPHTVTSQKDDGKTFDSKIIKPEGTFILDASKLADKEYDYFCTLHPYMKGKISIS
jgi:plastocyanin